MDEVVVNSSARVFCIIYCHMILKTEYSGKDASEKHCFVNLFYPSDYKLVGFFFLTSHLGTKAQIYFWHLNDL